jgi:hypothetical protein
MGGYSKLGFQSLTLTLSSHANQTNTNFSLDGWVYLQIRVQLLTLILSSHANPTTHITFSSFEGWVCLKLGLNYYHLGRSNIKNSHSTQTHPRQQKPNLKLEYRGGRGDDHAQAAKKRCK